MSRTLVIGVDAGATSTRCVVATLDGFIVSRGRAGGANPNSSGGHRAETLTAAIEAALSGSALAKATQPGSSASGQPPEITQPETQVGEAQFHDAQPGDEPAGLEGVDRAAVRLGVLGAAGSAGAGRVAFREAAEQAWARAGLTGEVVTVTDLEVAFAAGTAASSGALLLSGTGALAARFAGGVVERRCDGYGWLAGDEGSAVWLGVQALRAALAALDGRGEPTTLVALLCERFGIGWPPGNRGSLTQPVAAPGDQVRLPGGGRERRQESLPTAGEQVRLPGGGERREESLPTAGEQIRLPGGERGEESVPADRGSVWLPGARSERGGEPLAAAGGSVWLPRREGPVAEGRAGVGWPGSEGLAQGGLARAEREELAQALVAAGFGRAPAEWGLLAPAVSVAAEAGDPVARRIADAAAAKLLHAFDSVEPLAGADVVVAGSVLLSSGPVARAVREGLLARSGVAPREALDGAGGAAALAIGRLTGRPVSEVVHARLAGGAGAGRGHEGVRG